MKLSSVAGISLLLISLYCSLAFAANPFLQALVETKGGVTVTYGTNPSSLTAANIIVAAIKQIQPSWNNLRTAADFDADTFLVTGQTHVIAVGTLMDSKVLQARGMLPIKWLDRDYYYGLYDQLFDATVQPADFGMPNLPKTGFVIANFGDWPSTAKGIGIIECDRSNYLMEWMCRKRLEKVGYMVTIKPTDYTPNYPKDSPLYLVVRVTGSGDSGVVAAARAFANSNMLNGVVLNGTSASTSPSWSLPANKYYTTLPFTPSAGKNGYTYIGWLMGDQKEYTNIQATAGVTPVAIYRCKYIPPYKIKNFWSTPMREASELEVLALKFANAADAATANTKLVANIHGKSWNSRITGFNSTVVGSCVYMEAIPEPAGAAILADFAAMAGW